MKASFLNFGGLQDATRRWAEGGRCVEIDGRRVFVREFGAGPTLLLMHGYPTSSFDWRMVAELLADRRRVIVFDFLGFGLSDKPVAFSYSLFQQADLVEKLLAALGVAETSIVSHDMGTSVHSELLARRDEGQLSFAVEHSIFLNGSMMQWMARITPFQELMASNPSLPQAIELCRTSIEGLYVPALKGLMAVPESVSAEDEAVLLDLLKYQDGHLRLPAIAGYMRERYIHSDRWLGALQRCTSPIAFLWADADPIAHVEMGREHARRAPQATYVELAGLGHFLMMEAPHRVAEAVADLLKSR